MMRLLLLLGLFLLLASKGAAGSKPERFDARCPELARISLYTAMLGGFERLDVCPPIIYAASHPLATGPRQGRISGPARATAYYPETGAIQLSAQLDTTTVPGMSQLIHAMVHVYQADRARRGAQVCPRGQAREALEIQALFFAAEWF
ncbi:MAG: hypothetical protein AAF281_07055 [Pseudomonadota bacterium]